MSEYIHEDYDHESYREYPEAERVVAFFGEVETQINNPPGNDPYISAFGEAIMHEFFEGDRRFSGAVGEVLVARKDVPAPYVFNLILKYVQGYLMEVDPKYPYGYDNVSKWVEAIRDYIHDESFQNFTENLKQLDINSNVPDRYKGTRLVLTFFHEKLPEHPRILDIGCSQNLGLKRLMLGPAATWSPTVLHTNIETIQNMTDEERAENELWVRRTLRSFEHTPGPSVGIDIYNLNNPDVQKWARMCSFYPSELLDCSKLEEYDAMVRDLNFKNVDFFCGDITSLSKEQFESKVGDEKFDVIIFSTMLYELTPEQREAAILNAKKFAHDKSLIIYQDFCEVRRGKLVFYESLHKEKYRYRTIVEDMRNPGTLKEFIRWENGRCTNGLINQKATNRSIRKVS